MTLFLGQSSIPIVNWALIAPEVIVCAAAVVVMLVDAFVKPSQRWITGGISLAGLLGGAVATIWLWTSGLVAGDAFNRMIVLDELRLGFTLVFLLVSVLTLLISTVWVQGEELPAGEFHSLLLFATVGMVSRSRNHQRGTPDGVRTSILLASYKHRTPSGVLLWCLLRDGRHGRLWSSNPHIHGLGHVLQRHSHQIIDYCF